jgi:signal transduction histidine kinase
MPRSTSVGGRRARAAVRLRGVPVERNRRSRRDWFVDVLCLIFAVIIGVLAFADARSRSDYPTWFTLLDVAGGIGGCMALWVRRRRPLGLALALMIVATVCSTASGAALIAVFSLAVHRPWRQVAIAAAVALVTQPLNFALYPPVGDYVLTTLMTVVFFAAVIAWGMFVRARRQLRVSRVEHVRQQERARIAREMHDVLAHRISLLSLHAGALEFRPDAPPEEVARAAGVIRASAHQALEDLRAVIGVLREEPGERAPERPQPTLGDLPALIDESREAGVRVGYTWRLAPEAVVPDALGRNAYRIVQEGLTNARKHARGSAVEVSVDGEPGAGLTIEVRNRLPVGAYAAAGIPGTGTGIVGLAERASLAGGRLEHGRTDAGDYRLWAWLPWPA